MNLVLGSTEFSPFGNWINMGDLQFNPMKFASNFDFMQGIHTAYDSDGTVAIEFDVPGVMRENISATVKGDTITVQASQGGRSYDYSLTLTDVDFDSVEDSLSNGILTLRFKSVKSQPSERNLLKK